MLVPLLQIGVAVAMITQRQHHVGIMDGPLTRAQFKAQIRQLLLLVLFFGTGVASLVLLPIRSFLLPFYSLKLLAVIYGLCCIIPILFVNRLTLLKLRPERIRMRASMLLADNAVRSTTALAGDLMEEFHLFKAPELGWWKASFWLIAQILQSIAPLAWGQTNRLRQTQPDQLAHAKYFSTQVETQPTWARPVQLGIATAVLLIEVGRMIMLNHL